MRFLKNFFTVMVVFIVVMVGGCSVYGVTVKYNTPIMFKSKKFNDKALWVHASSRNIKNNETLDVGDWSKGRSVSRDKYVPVPENHHEVLVGTDSPSNLLDKSGNQIFVVQSVDDTKKMGDVLYGDKIKIVSYYSGAGKNGIAAEAGFQEKSRVLWVHYPARLYPNFSEIAVSVPDFLETQASKAHFAFMGLIKINGTPIDDGDVLYIKSLSGDEFSDGTCLWAFDSSRWGTGFGEILSHRGDVREMENGKFEICVIQKDALIPDGKVAYDKVMGVLNQRGVPVITPFVVPVAFPVAVKALSDKELKDRWDKYYSDRKKLDEQKEAFKKSFAL